ncbi:MAG: glycosyltransferase involved in cell wall biosynthesis [Litorivivens sp.]
MKIIYYSSHPNLNLAAPSGPGTHMREVIAGFEHAGHIVIPVILGGYTLDKSTSQKSGQPTWKQKVKQLIPSIIWQSLKDFNLLRFDRYAQSELQLAVDKEQPDMIYERGYYLMTSGVKVAAQNTIKHVIEINAPYPEEKVYMEGKSLFLHRGTKAEKEQALGASMVVVVSSALKSYLIERTGIDERKILVTPNAVDPAKFQNTNRLDTRKNLGYNESDIVVGFVGSIFPYHGVDHLLAGFIALRANDPNLRLLIVGDGETLPAIRQIAKKSRFYSDITFTGNVGYERIKELMGAMDMGVMPKSNWYGSPVKIFEYAMMKLAVIAPDNIPCRDVLVHEKNGLLISEDIKDLTEAIALLARDRGLRVQLGTAFHNQTIDRHTWQSVSDSVLSHCSVD